MILSKYRIRLGDILFGYRDDDTGESWVVSNLEGWQNTSTTGSTTQRTARKGAWRNRAQRAAKGYTLNGTVYTREPNVADALDRLLDAVPLDVPEAMVVEGVHADGDRQVFVRQEGDLVTQIISDYEATYSIGLVAPDPTKYGTTQHVTATSLPSSTGGLAVPHTVPFSIDAVTISGIARAVNIGNEPVSPRIIVYGPVSNPRLTRVDTGETLILRLDIADGDWIDLDFERHTAHLNGTASRRGYVSGTWFELAAKGATDIAFNASVYSSTASAQLVWYDGWK